MPTRRGLAGQEMIYEVLKRIIQQDIPQPMVNRGEYLWNPFSNKVFKDGKEIVWTPEPNTRYLHLLNIFKAVKDLDPFYPTLPSHAQRKFELERELPAAAVEKLFEEVLTSAQVKAAAALVEKRLGRKLQPFDIWYNGFKARGKITEAELDRRVSQKYPDLKAFENDMRNILQQLGFTGQDRRFHRRPHRGRPGPRRRPRLGRADESGKIAPAHPRARRRHELQGLQRGHARARPLRRADPDACKRSTPT